MSEVVQPHFHPKKMQATKKLDRLIVTVPDHTGHHTIFKLTSGGMKRFHIKKTFDLALPLDKNFYLSFLPNEIKMMIIKKLIHIYLKEALYELAMPLIALCKHTLKYIYGIFFPKPLFEVAISSLNFRISHTLHFCQAVIDAVVGCKKSFCNYYVVETRHGYFQGKCYPWYLDTELTISEMSHFYVQGADDHRCFSLGPDIHQFAWIQSATREGIHYCRYFRSPIIVLAIVNFNHIQIIRKEDLDDTFYAIKYFLCNVFGIYTGVYIFHPDDSGFEMHTVVEL